MNKTAKKIILSLILFLSIQANFMHFPYLFLQGGKLDKLANNVDMGFPQNSVDAKYQFDIASQTVTQGSVAGSYLNLGAADSNFMYISSTTSGVDVEFTFNDVRLWNADTIRVFYDGQVSNASLTYEIQIYDYANSTWRNINPHNTTNSSTTDTTTVGQLPSVASALPGGGVYDIYDGYFSNGSNTPISTPLGNFVNSSRQAKIRFYSTVSTDDLELRIDMLTIQPSKLPYYFPSSSTNNGNGAMTNEYNDLTTDDATTSVTVAGATGGISTDFYFTNVSLPYSDANTFLLEYSGHISTSNYSIAIYDYNDGAYETLNATTLTNTSDATNYFAKTPSVLGDSMADFIDEANNNKMNIRVTSPATSGTLTIDFIKIVIGSIHTSSGDYTSNITRGSTSSGTEASVKTLDTSAAVDQWVINATTAEEDTENSGDCTTLTAYCDAMQATAPMTIPDEHIVQSIIQYARFTSNNADSDPLMGIRDVGGSFDATTASGNLTALAMVIRETNNPMPQQIGYTALSTIPAFTPNSYVSKSTNSVTTRIYTPAAAAARTLSVDFVFVTASVISPLERVTYRKVPSGGAITYGTESASNYRFSQGDDTFYWTITQDGTNGVDAELSFSGVEIPNGANKIIVTSTQSFSVSSDTYKMYIYDYVNTTWRDLVPHTGNLTASGTANTQQYTQFEVFDGYFSNGSNSPVSTPISNFVSGGASKVRITSDIAVAGNLNWDFLQLQFVIDPAYHPADVVLTTGTATNEYNDTYTDEGTATTTTCNSSFFCYFVTPSGNTADFYFVYKNVAMPPEGFNALFVEFSGFKATSGSFDIELRNFTTGAWETIKSGITITADATHYFIKEIGDWRNYIDANNQMRVHFYSTGNANAVYVDYLQITMGTVPKDGSTVSSNYGAIMNGTASTLGNADTITASNDLDDTNYLTVTESNPTTGIIANDTMGGKSLTADIPLHMDPGTYPVGLIWNYRAAAASATAVITPTIEYGGFYYAPVSTSFQYSLVAANALPTAADTVTLTSASQTFRQGWYVEPLANLWNSVDNKVNFRLYTSTGLVNSEWDLGIDFIFLSYRWVPTEVTPSPDQQTRGGSYFFGGEEQKKQF